MLKKNKFKNIVFSGGHAFSTAFEVIKEIKRQKKPWNIYWFGPKSSFEGKNIPPLSSIYFPKYGIRTFSLITGRIQRNFTFWTIPAILKIPIGIFQALILFLRLKPDAVVSFGGFSSFPCVVAGFILRIPILIHEQTSVAGRSNVFSSFFAKKIAISRKTSKIYFPKEKIVFTGLPISRQFFASEKRAKGIKNKIAKVLVTGGQSGSSVINESIEKSLDELLQVSQIIHLTGLKDEEKFKKIRAKIMNKTLKKRYKVFGIVDPEQFNKLFISSSIAVSRAGANTVAKIVASHKPSILIPIPNSYLDEQTKNALFAKKYASAKILPQEKLTPSVLTKQILNLIKNLDKFPKKRKFRNPDFKAKEKLVSEIERLLK